MDDLYHSEEYDYDSENQMPETDDESICVTPPKRHCGENDIIYKDLYDRYQCVEKCDSEINESLANFINTSFRNGVSDDTLNDMLKDIHRPVNCEVLVKTKVNTCIWRLLNPQTQSEDVKFQAIQNILVKAASNFSKILDEESSNIDSQSLEWGNKLYGSFRSNE